MPCAKHAPFSQLFSSYCGLGIMQIIGQLFIIGDNRERETERERESFRTVVGVAEDVVQRLNSLSHLCQQVNVACPAEFLAIHQVAMAWRKKITLGLQVYVWWFRVCLVESLGRIGERQQQGKLRSFSHQQEGRASPARQYPSGSHAIPDQNAPLHQLA